MVSCKIFHAESEWPQNYFNYKLKCKNHVFSNMKVTIWHKILFYVAIGSESTTVGFFHLREIVPRNLLVSRISLCERYRKNNEILTKMFEK